MAKKTSAQNKPAGRPSIYSEELADRICEEMANGQSLTDVCKADDMPHRSTVFRWMEKRPEFATRIARTREGPQAEHLLDSMAEIEKKVLENGLDPQAARVVIWSRQWRAAKMAPKKYSDKLEISGNPENPLALMLQTVQGGALEPATKVSVTVERGE